MTTSPPLGGYADARFAPVRDVFARLLASGAETGAALAVTYDGTPVVGLHGGWRDPGRRQPWAPDTLVNTYSVSKPVAALCALVLVDRGRLGLDDPVAAHWPGFRAGDVTVRHVLSHTAGLPRFPVPRPAAAFGDWAQLTGDLAGAATEWVPGTAAAEHALTYGHLVGELVRRVDGRTLGRFLAEEIAAPWRLDLGFGLGAADQRRCADLRYGDPQWPRVTRGRAGSLHAAALDNPTGALDLSVVNGPLWRGSEIPAVNLHATAEAVARLYAGLLAGGVLGGVRLVGRDTVAEAVRVQYSGPDLMLERPVRWTLGMQVDDDGSWGMGGLGGNVGFADPVRGYAFAYVTGHLAGFERVDALADAVNDVIG
ncbi:beta-lactamase family protein [Planosporangium thailandense]|uniref:Beta-lactamase family protein n=1 Tax=Planosporangium thailandense TaxID=765197 RepID=A0ABX0Y5V2_9ACTN|nr:beta-lactamase family protein [Planosporangium thailandense]